MKTYHLVTPLKEEEIRLLRLGDVVYLSGHLYTSRDMAHLKYKALLEEGAPLPMDFNGSALFHAGPVCLKNDDGSWRLNLIGPTTSMRMEPYADMVGRMGVRAIIGKGGMGDDTLASCQKYGYVYLQAVPGAAAKLSENVTKVAGVTYFDLGMPEALWDLEIKDFGPLVVGMDTAGGSVYHKLRDEAFKLLDKMYPV